MSDNPIRRLHKEYTSGIYPREPDSRLTELYDKPHLAVFINGDWLPILPGMIIGLVKNRKHVDGVAPYILRKVSAKPGHEFIDLVAWSTNPENGRRLQFLANYSGVFRSGVDNADQAIDAAVNATKLGSDDSE